jgi:hypothetical protein
MDMAAVSLLTYYHDGLWTHGRDRSVDYLSAPLVDERPIDIGHKGERNFCGNESVI